MKILTLLFVAFVAGLSKGLDIALPSWEFADTEVSTNIVRRFSTEISGIFTYGITFDGTESNNIEIAFGEDADADLVLSPHDKTADIPMDYDGVMGVPITFMDRYCPEQFEIVGLIAGNIRGLAGIPTSTGKDGPYMNGKLKYGRILIRRK